MPTPSSAQPSVPVLIDQWKLQGFASPLHEDGTEVVAHAALATTDPAPSTSPFDLLYPSDHLPVASRVLGMEALDDADAFLRKHATRTRAVTPPNASWFKDRLDLRVIGKRLGSPAKPAVVTSFLKENSIFMGSQQSGRSAYEVSVQFKQVDLAQNLLAGYLTISGLTEGYPEIITYFEAEVVGARMAGRKSPVSFLTNKHEEWGSSDCVDIEHWLKFPSFQKLVKEKLDVDHQTETVTPAMIARLVSSLDAEDVFQNDVVYMRWKEKFLVPDATVTDITGASFSGFYYICFDQRNGSISGLYFHKTTESFQQLELCHIPHRGLGGSFSLQ